MQGTQLLTNSARAQEFAAEIVKINKSIDRGSCLLNGVPSTAIDTALRYGTAQEQGAAIFRSIAHGHMFSGGNKRTAVVVWRSFMRQYGIQSSLTNAQIMDIATKVATGKVQDVSRIASMLTK